MKAMIIPTFVFTLLVFILILIMYIIVAPILNLFSTIYYPIQENVEINLVGNVTDSTINNKKAWNNIKQALPYFVIFGFIIAIILYFAITQKQEQ